jgi:citrate lyase subunit beta/citryl-CoA lyase
VIHPDQLEAANRIFAPSRSALEDAQAIIAAFAEPENDGKGVIDLDGTMVERLHLAEAEGLVAMAEAIAAREEADS